MENTRVEPRYNSIDNIGKKPSISVKRFPERIQEMLDSKLVDRLRLAREALLLVSQGKSERSAGCGIAYCDPQLRRERCAALARVLVTVGMLVPLDSAVASAFPCSQFEQS